MSHVTNSSPYYAVTFVEFASATYTVSEEQSFVVLVVNKTGVTQEDVPVMIELADGTARGTSLANWIEALNFCIFIAYFHISQINRILALLFSTSSRYYSIAFVILAGDFFDYGPFNSPSLSVMARLFADEVSIPFGVLIREDGRVEHEEFFTATLTLPPIEGSNVQLGSTRNTTVVIKDNDSTHAIFIYFIAISVRIVSINYRRNWLSGAALC